MPQPMPQPMPQAQPQPQAQIPQRSPQPKISVADELLKLKQLLDAGALTQQEFDQQKAKLLGN
ncbi:MAG: SHOCT domain-containing protein [Actinomycetaceae bacterium]|nr:SHOCT domain-containing protein [Actinomycetaceae bacterium]